MHPYFESMKLFYYYEFEPGFFVVFNEDVAIANTQDDCIGVDLFEVRSLSNDRIKALLEEFEVVDHNPMFNGKLLQYALDILYYVEPKLKHRVQAALFESYKVVAKDGFFTKLKNLGKDIGKSVKDTIKENVGLKEAAKKELQNLIEKAKSLEGGDEFVSDVGKLMSSGKIDKGSVDSLVTLLERNPNWIKFLDFESQDEKKSIKLEAFLKVLLNKKDEMLEASNILVPKIENFLSNLVKDKPTGFELKVEIAGPTTKGKNRKVIVHTDPGSLATIFEAMKLHIEDVSEPESVPQNFERSFLLKDIAEPEYFTMDAETIRNDLEIHLKGKKGSEIRNITESKEKSGNRTVTIEYRKMDELDSYLRANKLSSNQEDIGIKVYKYMEDHAAEYVDNKDYEADLQRLKDHVEELKNPMEFPESKALEYEKIQDLAVKYGVR